MTDGRVIRVGYAGKNGQPYRSIGQELVRRGIFTLDQVSAQVIRSWVKRNPGPGQELMNHNPSYVFFRKIAELPADKGPIGAMGRSITTMRSIAIDPVFTMLGTPVWIEKDGRAPLRRLIRDTSRSTSPTVSRSLATGKFSPRLNVIASLTRISFRPSCPAGW